jgi:hypothetical protein
MASWKRHGPRLGVLVPYLAACAGEPAAREPAGRDAAVDDSAVLDAAAADDAFQPGERLCDLRLGLHEGGVEGIRYESREHGILVHYERRHDGPGGGESFLFSLLGFGVRYGGQTDCVTDASALEYESSHHNMRDRVIAQVRGTRFEILTLFLTGPVLTVTDTDTGRAVLESVPLLVTGSGLFCVECGAPHVIVSEVMAESQAAFVDEAGEPEPFVELLNGHYEDVSLEGYTLSNDLFDRRMWALPAITLPASGRLVVAADGEPTEGPQHASFRLGPGASAIILTDTRGATAGGLEFDSPGADVSLGYVAGAPQYRPLAAPSPGAKNME